MRQTKHTDVYVVFEHRSSEVENQMTTELLVRAGVEVQHVFRRAFNPINFHQLFANILLTHKQMIEYHTYVQYTMSKCECTHKKCVLPE